MGYSPVALGAGWVVLSYLIYSVIASFLQKRHHHKLAKEWKCEEPIRQINKLPLGIDNLKRALKADREKVFPTDATKRFDDVGSHTYRASVLGFEGTATCEPKNIQALLATQFQDYDLGPVRRGNFFPLLGNGIFTQDGAAWEHSRAMMRPQFARDQVSDLDLEEKHVQNMMRALLPNSDQWTNEVDLQVLFFRLTLDSATEFLFGQSVDSQLAMLPTASNPTPSIHNESVFARAFDQGQAGLATRSRFGDKYWLANSAAFRKANKQCHDFIDHFVALALSKELGEKAAEKDEERKEKYVFLEQLAQKTRDPIELRSQLLHILLAGRDTTASLLGWLYHSLARSPTHYHKLRQAIIDDFGPTANASTGITFSRLKSCVYLQQCINETLRLYPVVPANARTANKDTTLPTGGGKDGKSKIFVPKGMPVEYSVHAMQRRKDLWGQDAEEFKPERWEGKRPGWEYLPFNGGPRICIGQQFALTEASYVVVRMMQRFDSIENLDPSQEILHNLTLTNCPGSGVKVRLHAAAAATA